MLALPDGSKVWLNAASSITYPVAFMGNMRKVTVSGELYFEVAKDKDKPFIVDIEGKSVVQVLGTSFNIKAYGDEASIKTTLVEGSVKLNEKVVLAPGQQAVTTLGESKIVKNADLEQVLAWKNGIFNFTGQPFTSVIKDVERWYDIDVKFGSNIPAFNLKGKMDKGVSLQHWIQFLSSFGLRGKLEGRTLVIENL